MAAIDTTLEYVRTEGLSQQSGPQLRQMLDALYLDAPARTLAIELAAFVRDESAKAGPGEISVGTAARMLIHRRTRSSTLAPRRFSCLAHTG